MDEVAVLAANALVSSCLNYFRSLSSFNICHAQTAVYSNTLARIVTSCNRNSKLSAVLKELHWSPVKFHCFFKTATLVYKFLHSCHASYFSAVLSINCGRCGTRYISPDKRFLVVAQYYQSVHISKKHFDHSFSFDASTVWNDLPDNVCSAPTPAHFRRRLKSYPLTKGLAYKRSDVCDVDLAMSME